MPKPSCTPLIISGGTQQSTYQIHWLHMLGVSNTPTPPRWSLQYAPLLELRAGSQTVTIQNCQWLCDITVHMGCASTYMFCNLIPSPSYYKGTISVKSITTLHSHLLHELPPCSLCDFTARKTPQLLCLGAYAQRRHMVVCWCFCHSVILSVTGIAAQRVQFKCWNCTNGYKAMFSRI